MDFDIGKKLGKGKFGESLRACFRPYQFLSRPMLSLARA